MAYDRFQVEAVLHAKFQVDRFSGLAAFRAQTNK
jgi:hypothetical protein